MVGHPCITPTQTFNLDMASVRRRTLARVSTLGADALSMKRTPVQ